MSCGSWSRYPSCAPPLDALLDALPALAPRMYSIASSPLAQPHQARITRVFWPEKSAIALGALFICRAGRLRLCNMPFSTY